MELRRFESHEDAVMAAAVTPDGQRALSACDDRSLRLWDLEHGAELTAFHAHAAIQCCAVSQDGNVLSPAMPLSECRGVCATYIDLIDRECPIIDPPLTRDRRDPSLA